MEIIIYFISTIIIKDYKSTAFIIDRRKLVTANQQLSMINRVLYWVPTNVKLLAYSYKTLSLFHLVYAVAAWDPSSRKYQT